MKKKLLFSFLLLLLLSFNSEAGDSLKVFRRMGLYGELGGGEFIHYSMNAEYYLLNNKLLHLGVRGGYGTWGAFDSGHGPEAIAAATGLLGKRYNFLEIQYGVDFLLKKPTEPAVSKTKQAVLPLIAIGYNLRYKHFQLKANVNTTMTINMGLGLVF